MFNAPIASSPLGYDPAPRLAGDGPPFFIAEITIAKTGNALSISYGYGYDVRPIGTLSETTDAPLGATSTLMVSDGGYRTSQTDAGIAGAMSGVVSYPPSLSSAFQINRAVNLDPSTSGVAASWGQLSLLNYDHSFDQLSTNWNSDNRPVKIYYGQRQLETSRRIWLDPSYSTLNLAFAGVSTPWTLSDTTLNVPIRDATYWLEQPINSTQYGGTGGNDGVAAMAGIPKPMLRGVCYNITPTCIDATNRYYQYNNAPGTIQNLYEGGALTITFQSDVADLTVGTTNAGQYRTCNAMGMFQLGSTPIHQITVDATGQFAVAGTQTIIANIARYMMTEDMVIPSTNINITSFTTAATAYPYAAGIYIDSTQNPLGTDVLDTLMESLAGKITISRSGQLQMTVLRAIPANTTSVGQFDTTNIISIIPKALPSTLTPPPYRWRVGYGINYTVQTSDLNTGTTTAAHKLYIATQNQYAIASSTSVLATFARPNDHAPIGGALNNQADAQSVANAMISLWSTTRALYTITLPISVGLARDIGDVVTVQYPIGNLASGMQGQIVAEVFNSQDSTIAYDVLI